MSDGLLRATLDVRAKADRHARVTKPVARSKIQVPVGVRAEVPELARSWRLRSGWADLREVVRAPLKRRREALAFYTLPRSPRRAFIKPPALRVVFDCMRDPFDGYMCDIELSTSHMSGWSVVIPLLEIIGKIELRNACYEEWQRCARRCDSREIGRAGVVRQLIARPVDR